MHRTRSGAAPGSSCRPTPGISLGPKISAGIIEGEVVSLDGTVAAFLCDPMKFEVTGTGKVFDFPIGKASVKYLLDKNTAEIGGVLDMTVLDQGAQIEIKDGVISPDRINVEGKGTLKLFGWDAEAEGILSSVGGALCARYGSITIGGGGTWAAGWKQLGSSCAIGDFRAPARVPPRPATRASRSRAAPLARSSRCEAPGAPPKVALVAPGARGSRCRPGSSRWTRPGRSSSRTPPRPSPTSCSTARRPAAGGAPAAGAERAVHARRRRRPAAGGRRRAGVRPRRAPHAELDADAAARPAGRVRRARHRHAAHAREDQSARAAASLHGPTAWRTARARSRRS